VRAADVLVLVPEQEPGGTILETPHEPRIQVDVTGWKECTEPPAEDASGCQGFNASKVSNMHCSDEQTHEAGALSGECLSDAECLVEMDVLQA
jgi:hypothetical protein